MVSIEERRKQADKQLARYERQEREKRLQARREREAQKKAQQRRNYLAGELVFKHFPQLTQVDALEEFFIKLADAPEVREVVGRLVEMSVDGQQAATVPEQVHLHIEC